MTRGPLLIFLAAVLWGLDGVLRRSLAGLPPVSVVFFEHLIGAIIIAPFLVREWRAERPHLSAREWSALGVVALASGLLGTLFFTAALMESAYIPFSVVFLMQKLQPLFAIAMAALILKERITRRYLVWALLALVAGFFVSFPNGVVNWGAGGAYVQASLLALAAAALWGSSTAFSRFILLRRSNTVVTGLRFFLTVPLALLAVFLMGAAPSLGSITLPQIGTLALIAASTGMAALWIYYRGLSATPARVSAIVELAFPITAILLDYALYGTVLAWSQYAAAGVLLFAMYMVARNNMAMHIDGNTYAQ